MESVTLTVDECKALHQLISELSGGKPETVFTWCYEEDDPNDPTTSACAKIYEAAGQRIPVFRKVDSAEG